MVHFIDKDALVAEIERLISNGQVKLQESQESNDNESYVAWAEHIATCIKVLSFINTLEVKEVDLDFMLHEYWNLSSKITIDCLESATMTKDEMINFAKHFFGLGLKAQKEE